MFNQKMTIILTQIIILRLILKIISLKINCKMNKINIRRMKKIIKS